MCNARVTPFHRATLNVCPRPTGVESREGNLVAVHRLARPRYRSGWQGGNRREEGGHQPFSIRNAADQPLARRRVEGLESLTRDGGCSRTRATASLDEGEERARVMDFTSPLRGNGGKLRQRWSESKWESARISRNSGTDDVTRLAIKSGNDRLAKRLPRFFLLRAIRCDRVPTRNCARVGPRAVPRRRIYRPLLIQRLLGLISRQWT